VLLGRKVARLNRVHDAITALGAPAPLLYPLDLEGATAEDYAQLAARIGAACGRLDGLLHCAAHFRGLTPLELTDPGELARAVHVNLTARCWLTQACLPLLRQSADAAVVFALDAMPVGAAYWGGYGLAQAALAALVPMAQAELAASSVRVSGFMPGPLRTALRARAFAEGDALLAGERPARAADAAAADCLALFTPAGRCWRGKIWTAAAAAQVEAA